MQSMQSFGAVEIFATEMLIAVHVLFLTQGNIWGDFCRRWDSFIKDTFAF